MKEPEIEAGLNAARAYHNYCMLACLGLLAVCLSVRRADPYLDAISELDAFIALEPQKLGDRYEEHVILGVKSTIGWKFAEAASKRGIGLNLSLSVGHNPNISVVHAPNPFWQGYFDKASLKEIHDTIIGNNARTPARAASIDPLSFADSLIPALAAFEPGYVVTGIDWKWGQPSLASTGSPLFRASQVQPRPVAPVMPDTEPRPARVVAKDCGVDVTFFPARESQGSSGKVDIRLNDEKTVSIKTTYSSSQYPEYAFLPWFKQDFDTGPFIVMDGNREVLFPKLMPVWDLVKGLRPDQALQVLRQAHAARQADPRGSVLGVEFHGDWIIAVGSVLLVVFYSLLFAHVSHVGRLSREDPQVATRYPWVVLFPGVVPRILTVATVILLPFFAAAIATLTSWRYASVPFRILACLGLLSVFLGLMCELKLAALRSRRPPEPDDLY